MKSGDAAEVAGYLARWKPAAGTLPAAAGFALSVVAAAGPGSQDRAKCLLWAACKLARYGIGLGLDPVPEVLLHPAVIERFTTCAPGMSGAARRTLRTNLRFIARAVVPHLDPADAPLPRQRAKAPYSPAEIAGYLALAAAMLAGCGTTMTPSASSTTGGAAATHTSAAASCKQQYKAWKYGPARAIVKQQLGPALKAVTAAGSVKMQAALKRTSHVAAELAAYPIPRCADPKGYWRRMLALLQAAGDNASTSGGLAALLAAMGPLQSVQGIQAKLGAELKKNAGIK